MVRNRRFAARTRAFATAAFAAGAASAALILAAPLAAQSSGDARTPSAYTSTVMFGTGLIIIPVAWVSPESGDLFASFSARIIGQGDITPKASGSLWDLTQSVEAHLGGRVSVGASLYSTKHQQIGGFAQALLVRQSDGGPGWLPSIAVGARNLGSSKYQDRFVTGDKRAIHVLEGAVQAGQGEFNGSPTLYAVATRDFRAGGRRSLSLTAGYGNGLFKETGNLGTVYNKTGTLASGVFGGVRFAIPWKETRLITLIGENDGFDYNAGATMTLGHLSVGFYFTELEERHKIPVGLTLANFTKTAFRLSYNSTLQGVMRGARQRAEASDAKLELRRLQQEIAQRRAITARLVADLSKAEAAASAAREAKRATLLKELEAERAALKAAADRLEQLQRKPPERP
ncbi:MAG: hypothetical protein FJ202_07005 [Gemmatimonadetes bacterium]|nr:hypothetical protein [Gemmatimonadota bacterium]